MVQSKMKSLSAYEKVVVVFEHFLQSILAIIALGVVYRYCWIGLFPTQSLLYSIGFAKSWFCRYIRSLQMWRTSQ